MRDRLLTIDVGTGSSRAALLQPDGEIIGFAQREYDQVTPQAGWSEQQPSMWWQCVCECLKELTHCFPEDTARIASVAVCGQMHGTVLLDSDGNLITDCALLWNDKRSQPQVNQFVSHQSDYPWREHLNNPPTAAWPAFKLAWWKDNHPEVWSRIAMVLMPKDYINYKLSGIFATDYSEASCFYLMDSRTRTWSVEALAAFSVRADQLPTIRLSSDVIGEVTDLAASQTGLPPGVPVVAGTSDMAATLLGSGVFEPGTASDSTGTSTLLTVVSREPLLGEGVNNLHLANSLWGGFTLLDAGGDAVRWARLAFSENKLSHNALLAQANSVPPGAEGLIFLPYLTGERVAVKTNSRAQFFGIQRKHRAAHFYRAVLEGVALASWRNLQQLRNLGLKPEQLIASGGGARSPLWLQIKASVYDMPILQTRNRENGTTGCAIIAGVGVGLYSDFPCGVRKMVSFEEEIYPDPRMTEFYRESYALFDKLYQQSLPLYDLLESLSDYHYSNLV